jgi:hypothetical protein
MAIDRKKAIEDLSKIKVSGNKDGLLPMYGVLVNHFPANFWNLFSYKIIQKAGEDLFEATSGLLENAASQCGYHTGWGIINSEEFKAIVMPMVEKKPEDILHGAYAVFTAWGWANAEIVELIPAEKMVVRAYNYYESDVKNFGEIKTPFAFMLAGVARAFFDIAYGQPYPNGFGFSQCKQTKGIEIGDPYGEFVVTKAPIT